MPFTQVGAGAASIEPAGRVDITRLAMLAHRARAELI